MKAMDRQDVNYSTKSRNSEAIPSSTTVDQYLIIVHSNWSNRQIKITIILKQTTIIQVIGLEFPITEITDIESFIIQSI